MTKRPLHFASRTVVKSHETLARDFLERILDVDYDRCIITDKSSLSDFDLATAACVQRITAAYGVDVSDIQDGRLVSIFERIAQGRAHPR